MRRSILVLTLAVSAVLVLRAAQVPSRPAPSTAPAEAIRLNNLGVANMNQQRFEEALGFFDKAVATDAGFVTAQVNRAIALLGSQRHEDAREVLERVVNDDPQHARAWYNLGLLLRSTGEADESLAAFERAGALRPADPHTQYFIGLSAAQVQDYDKAIAAFRRALELDEFLVSAEFGMARALQRAGRADDAKVHIDRFQRLTTEKVATAMSLAYGDQGPLSLAEAVLPRDAPPTPTVPVTFVAADSQPFTQAVSTPGAGASEPGSIANVGQGAAFPVGQGFSPATGGCFLDFDGDLALDYLALHPSAPSGGPDAIVLHRGTGGGGFERVKTAGLAVNAQPLGCVAADYDNDERTDVAVSLANGVVLFRNDGDGTFTDVTAKAGIAVTGGGTPFGLTFVDYDHDGDLDLIVPRSTWGSPSGLPGTSPSGPSPGGATASPTTLVFRNNGDGRFTEVGAERGLAAPGIAAIGTDFNNDRAIDLVVTGEATPSVYVNPREGAFTRLPWPAPAESRTVGVVVLDFDKDGWMDLAFTHEGAPGISLWRNLEGKAVERVTLPKVPLARGWGLAVLDYDNDGWLDLVAAGSEGESGRIVVLRNDHGTYADATRAVGADALALASPRGVIAGDIDMDGDVDLVVTHGTAAPLVLRNEGGNANHALRVALNGLNDNRSGIGTKVEVQAGAIWQKWETVAASGFLGQGSPFILAGIGKEQTVDVVRLLWPTGVVQDEVQLAAAKPAAIDQVDRRGSSCPVLFTWNGREYEFITDAIGPAVVGHWVAPGQRNVPDPNEYLKVRGDQLVPKDGRLSLKFTEPMEEVIYLDQVRVFAIDHPADADIYPHEYFAALAPQPPDQVFVSRGLRLPAGAWDHRGRDVMPALREADRRYVDGFSNAPFKGFAELHGVDLDLGPLPAGGPVRLVMDGFTDYFTATSTFAAHQADVTAIVPYLEAQRADGSWIRVSDDIGFPAGLYRTMTADLTGLLPEGTRRIRIRTNLKIYWDRILIDTTPAGEVPSRRSEAPLVDARLAFRGFQREIPGSPAADLRYVYDQVSRYGPWARHRGFYTRYGSVSPLLTDADDRYVIFGAGDEVALEFDATALPPVPDGWKRDYLVYFHGYVKDMDFYAAHAQTVTPLPFAAMGSYPYPDTVSYPERNHEYLLEWNTREVRRESWPSYRLEYRD
jgi:Tfp pilus assembly protein PilF